MCHKEDKSGEWTSEFGKENHTRIVSGDREWMTILYQLIHKEITITSYLMVPYYIITCDTQKTRNILYQLTRLLIEHTLSNQSPWDYVVLSKAPPICICSHPSCVPSAYVLLACEPNIIPATSNVWAPSWNTRSACQKIDSHNENMPWEN